MNLEIILNVLDLEVIHPLLSIILVLCFFPFPTALIIHGNLVKIFLPFLLLSLIQMHSNFINLWKVFELSLLSQFTPIVTLVEAFTVSMVIGELSILIELLLSAIEDSNKRFTSLVRDSKWFIIAGHWWM